MTSALLVCIVLYRRSEPHKNAAAEVLLSKAAVRWRDSITTHTLAMAGV